MRRALLALGIAALLLSASGDPLAGEASARRVLFVGNSLTYANDLPAMVAALSRRGGGEPALEVEAATLPNASLEDHWAKKEALRAIERGGWSAVVLQQGPSSLPENRANLVAWTKRFAKRIRAIGARPALYTVWPAAARAGDFPRVEASYAAAAEAVDGLLLPAGAAWRAAWRRDPDLPLYASDGFHPSPLGTYLAAIVIEAALTDRPPRDGAIEIALAGGALSIPAERARLLADAAAEALAKH
ncbi:MAG: hypothetical protein H6511_05565 [Holophagales bacterium]|nr:hypothetical protein [Holophagales bacterium]